MTYLVYQSLNCRVHTAKRPYFFRKLFKQLETEILDATYHKKERVAIFFDRETFEEARKDFNKIASEGKQNPFCVFLKEENENVSLYKLPVSFLLKPNVEEVIQNLETIPHAAISHTIEKATKLTDFFVKDFVSTAQKITLENIADQAKEIIWLIESSANKSKSRIKKQLYEIGMVVVD